MTCLTRWLPSGSVLSLALLIAFASLVFPVFGYVSAQTTEGGQTQRSVLGGTVRNGLLVVEGRGFAPGERVTVRVQTRGANPPESEAQRAGV